MRHLFVVAFFIFTSIFAFAKSPAFDCDYIQRGILQFNEEDFSFMVYVKNTPTQVCVVVQSQGVTIASVKLDKNGNLIELQGSEGMSKEVVEKIVLPNVYAMFGLFEKINAKVVRVFVRDGNLEEVKTFSPDCTMVFSDYRKSIGCERMFAHKLTVLAKDYKLTFEIVRISASKK